MPADMLTEAGKTEPSALPTKVTAGPSGTVPPYRLRVSCPEEFSRTEAVIVDIPPVTTVLGEAVAPSTRRGIVRPLVARSHPVNPGPLLHPHQLLLKS